MGAIALSTKRNEKEKRMSKVIEIKKGGYTFHINLDAVAKNRAEHYSDESETAFDDEYAFTMEDSYQAIDWYQNNMDWDMIPPSDRKLVDMPKAVASPDEIESDDFEIEIIEGVV
jgi:hypothetical protein